MHTALRNPETGGTWDCPDAVVDHFLSRGWVRKDAPVVVEQEEPKSKKAARRGHTSTSDTKE